MHTIHPRFRITLRHGREASRMSQDEIGRRVGVSGVQISRIEQGRRSGSIETIVALATILDVDLNQMKPDPLEDADTELYAAPPV